MDDDKYGWKKFAEFYVKATPEQRADLSRFSNEVSVLYRSEYRLPDRETYRLKLYEVMGMEAFDAWEKPLLK